MVILYLKSTHLQILTEKSLLSSECPFLVDKWDILVVSNRKK